MRHPHVSAKCCDEKVVTAVAAPEPKSSPAVLPTFAQLPANPRWSYGAVSTMYVTEPLNSPPTESP